MREFSITLRFDALDCYWSSRVDGLLICTTSSQALAVGLAVLYLHRLGHLDRPVTIRLEGAE